VPEPLLELRDELMREGEQQFPFAGFGKDRVDNMGVEVLAFIDYEAIGVRVPDTISGRKALMMIAPMMAAGSSPMSERSTTSVMRFARSLRKSMVEVGWPRAKRSGSDRDRTCILLRVEAVW
jgi:hypothetical protein